MLFFTEWELNMSWFFVSWLLADKSLYLGVFLANYHYDHLKVFFIVVD